MRPRRGLVFALTVGAIQAAAHAQTPSFNLVGVTPGALNSHITALSADGRVAAGYSEYEVGVFRQTGFTWTSAGGRLDFGLLPGVPPVTGPAALSTDGSLVVGDASLPGPSLQVF